MIFNILNITHSGIFSHSTHDTPLRNDDVYIPPAGHLGMADDQVFMYREDWLDNGEPFSKVFCPVSATERAERLKGKERRDFVAGQEEGEMESDAMHASAFFSRYDWDLHQMVAYMRRLYGATQSRTSFFNFWTYVVWDNVFFPVLGKAFGQNMRVLDVEDVDDLVGAKVMM